MVGNRLSKWDKAHLNNIAVYQKQVEELYDQAAQEVAGLAAFVGELGDKPFSWKDYPLTKQGIEKIINGLYTNLAATIANGINLEWQLSDKKNDELATTMLGDHLKDLSEKQRKLYFAATATAAGEAFIKRKTNGLTLSERVWNYTQGFKQEMELALDCGIRDGKASNRLATQLKQYLRYPDKLFRRVRNEHGQLVLSKAAKAFHPGRGVYRSSYMNARRLAATETNIAYRTADHERWQAMDFVVGIRVVLSNNHNCKGFKPGTFHDICDDLSAPIDYKDGDKCGLYPKDFKFTGWHPHCRCHVVPVLKTQEEFLADLNRKEGEATAPSVNEVMDVPQEFKDWVNNNKGNIEAATKRGTLPYFIKYNQARVNGILNPKPEEPSDNISQLAAQLGITKGKPMTHEEADHRLGNPHYNGRYNSPYSINCQSCVVAYEARRRGLDVAAMPNFDVKGSAVERLSRKDSLAWIDPLTGEHAKVTRAASPQWKGSKIRPATYEQIVNGVTEATREEGRYVISLYWEGNQGRSGHIFCVERLKDGTLRSFDPQNGKNNVLNEYLLRASGERTVNVIRVDNKEFDIDIASKVLTKQTTERFASVVKARAAKGGVLGVPKKNSFKEYKNDLIKSSTPIQRKEQKLATGEYFQSHKTLKDAIGHAKNKVEADAYMEISENISKLKYIAKSPLGDGKNQSSITDQKNLAKKKDRGVTHYNIYRYTDKNGIEWEVKTEVRRNKKETIYFVKKK